MLSTRLLPYIVFGLLLCLSLYFNYFYYSTFTSNTASVGGYILILFLIFGAYKFFQSIMGVKSYEVTPLTLIGVFFLHFLILCMYYVGISGSNFLLGTTVWIFISIQLIAILFFWYLIYLLGKRCIRILGVFSDTNSDFISIITSLVIGFFLLIWALFLIASIGFYNIYGFLFIAGAIFVVTFPLLKNALGSIRASLWTADVKTDAGYVATFINELHYVILTLFIGVNFLSAYRPYPIGWDDLGAYMNYPKLLSGTEGLIAMGNMYSWELYTGIGYIFGSQSFAFLMNSFSGVVAALVLFLGFALYKKNEQNTGDSVFSYPLLATLILMLLPMTVFQLAKDMKLDYGLLFVSMGAFFLSYYALYKDISLKNNWKIWLLVGMMIGFAFTIKITSLLLLLGIISFIAYRVGGLFLYLTSFFMILAIFTYAGLWGMLNVIFPDDLQVRIYYALGALVFAFITGVIVIKREIGFPDLLLYFKYIAILILGFIIAFLPWGVKHISEIQRAGSSYSVGSLISGVSERFRPDYSLIYSSEELKDITQTHARGLTEEGTTTNEDFGRYFGYEGGINNYIKLPWNLTFQVNQGGEFTAITYIFFILLPVFLFVFSYKKKVLPYILFGALILTLLYFMPSGVSQFITDILGNLRLPFGYIFIALFYFALIVILDIFLKKEKGDYAKLYKGVLAFGTVYVFFWAISAFGIVWYGIVMYAIFLSLIVIGLYQSDVKGYKLVPYCALFSVWIYIIFSGFAHATSNMKNAGYLDFKVGQLTEYQAIMKYHPEYFSFLFSFNLSEEGQEEIMRIAKSGLIEIFSSVDEQNQLLPVIARIESSEELNNLIQSLDTFSFPRSVERSYNNLKQDIFSAIIHPSDRYQSNKNIYRLGTFMTYFMVENNTRVWSDNLLNAFDAYVWDEDIGTITERLQKLGVRHVIFDLNAATIDEDPRKDLTRRYENLLRYSLSDEVDFIAGDSVCYRLARDLYQFGRIPLESAMGIAGINYGSSGERQEKMTDCIITLYEAINQGIYEESQDFVYLLTYKNRLEQIKELLVENNIEPTEHEILSQFSRSIGRGYKILLRIPQAN